MAGVANGPGCGWLDVRDVRGRSGGPVCRGGFGQVRCVIEPTDDIGRRLATDAMYGLAPTVKLPLESRELAASMYQAFMGGRVRPPAKIG